MAIPAEILLATPELVKKWTNINGTVDDNFINQSMALAQDKWIQPVLGDSLMLKIKTDTQAGTIAGIYLTLRDSYILKALVWATYVEVMPSLAYKIDNGYINQRISDDGQPVSDQVMKDIRNGGRDNLKYYIDRLGEYLCANSAEYVEYSNNVSPQRGPDSAMSGASAMQISSGRTASSGWGNYWKPLNQLP